MPEALDKKREAKEEDLIDFIKLDVHITPELEAEGYAREISRQIQAYRKTLGLQKQDKIELAIFCDDNFAKILQTQEDFLKERTNSKILKFNKQKKETFKNKTDFKIKDNRGEIGITYKNTKK